MNIKGLAFFTLAVTFCAGSCLAQETAKPKPKSQIRTITGCLSKGDGADEFVLTTKDGSTWELRSTTVKMSRQVGHTVAAHGVVSNAKMHNLKEDAKSAAVDSGAKKNDSEHGHLKVTVLKMVADSCKE
jgi:Protein of unknown function (DUF5818)